MIHLDRISKAHGDQILFEEVSLVIESGDRIGLTGPNGTGKTTLIDIIAGIEKADSGQISYPKDLRIGVLPQEIVPGNRNQVVDEVLTEFPCYLQYHRLLGLPPDEIDHHELLALQDEVELRCGFDLEAKILDVLGGLGFDDRHLAKRIDELSGGFRMRVFLAKLLVKDLDVILLDEPTNHLDMASLLWLEQYLESFNGAMVIITHDRYFLNTFATRIAHLERAKLSLVKGNYDDFLRQTEAEEEYLRKEYEKQQKEIKHLQSYIDKYIGQPKRSRMVGSRKKMLERLEEVKLPPPSEPPIRIWMPEIPQSGREVLRLEQITKNYPDTPLYTDLTFDLYRGDRVALVGPNGSGKTTLLKLMAEVIQPDAGQVRVGHNVERFYYTQHHLEQLEPTLTVFQEVFRSAGSNTDQAVRNILGAFKFSGDTIDKPIAALSGGEKARVALCKMILTRPNLLLLDEPTNHLDMASREVLIDALVQYQGTLVVISHDRYFIDRIANKIAEVYRGQVNTFLGTFSDYRPKSKFLTGARMRLDSSWRVKKVRSIRTREQERERKRQQAEERNRRYRQTKELRDRLAHLEKSIGRLEQQKRDLYQQMALPETYEDIEAYQELLGRSQSVEQELRELISEWETLSDKIEAIEGEEAPSEP